MLDPRDATATITSTTRYAGSDANSMLPGHDDARPGAPEHQPAARRRVERRSHAGARRARCRQDPRADDSRGASHPGAPDKRFRVLALTFTTKAAEEMRQRVAGLLGPDIRRARLTTFHGFATDVLRQ